ncbi:uncharacterized protein At4g38062-like [Lotus japonicus]|uniref:uncharacterized protein At4g38062-like n=1 Tax=Lotus japonicus TaxID=34305 RepID=UPI0025844D34|nr:uncharacterized protein At4g38062-like [Lotus japonicus]XP_057421162.1 uncharacterized protein At4g38062-like [Lotus japonicus]
MDNNIYEELDEAKAEIERLKSELRAKIVSLENLKKSHYAQENQIQEAKLKAENLDQELLQKESAIAEAKQLWEDLKGNLNEQASIIKHLTAANDKLRVDCDEKFNNWENEKNGLLLALDEANEKAESQEQQIYLYRQEIQCLKDSLSVSQKKCLENEKNFKASNELRERDDLFQKIEDEKRKVEDQLKWKKEQFKHLEEAHEKLRDEFRSCKKEWEMLKSTLLDEISSLEIKLDSQDRISENLQHQLQTCHQALAHVESQKKRLEVEVSDFKEKLDNASSEYQDARLQLDCLNSQCDSDIADLRYSLKANEAYHKELKYRIEKLEQENQELRMSLKEFQEAQIQEAGGSYSQSKPKRRNLEQTHSECSSNFKAKEAEWNSQLEQLKGDLNSCRSELETKIAAVEELQKELERSHSLTIEMKLVNEEMSVMLLVLKTGLSEAQEKLANHKNEMDLFNKEREEKIFQLMQQLEMKDAALISANKSINEECEREACLMRQVESCESKIELQHSLQDELDKHKEMLEESSMYQLILKETVLQMECYLKEQMKEVHDALDSTLIELDERICERNEMEFELQIWKSIVERMKNDLEENYVMRKELETSLLSQVDVCECLKEEKESLVYKLEEEEKRLDNVRYLQIIEEKDKALEELQKEVVLLEQESFRRELENVLITKGTMERIYEYEKENLIQLMKGKNMRIDELMQQVASMEQQFSTSLSTFSSQFDKTAASQILAAVEIEEKKLMIVELEDDLHAMHQKLKLQEENLKQSENLALDNIQVKELKDEMEKRNLLEMSSQRECLLAYVQGFIDKISEFSSADTQLMDMLRGMEKSFGPEMNLKKDESFYVKENMLIHSPKMTRKLEAVSDIRSPFRELNS